MKRFSTEQRQSSRNISSCDSSCLQMNMLTIGLTIVRHGETQWNKDGLLQGQTIDSPLSEEGHRQAEAVGRYLGNVRFSHVYTSDMLRARQTAESIVKHNRSCSALQVVCDPLLKERSFGAAEGKTVAEFHNMAKSSGQALQDFTPPGGETQAEVQQRVVRFLAVLLGHIGPGPGEELRPATAAAAPHGAPDEGVAGVPLHVLLVSHGALMRVAVRYFLEELRCPPLAECGAAHMLSLCPNTGLCRFLLTAGRQEGQTAISAVRCVFVHRRDHV